MVASNAASPGLQARRCGPVPLSSRPAKPPRPSVDPLSPPAGAVLVYAVPSTVRARGVGAGSRWTNWSIYVPSPARARGVGAQDFRARLAVGLARLAW